MNIDSILSQIDEEVGRLQQARSVLVGLVGGATTPVKRGRRKKRATSPLPTLPIVRTSSNPKPSRGPKPKAKKSMSAADRSKRSQAQIARREKERAEGLLSSPSPLLKSKSKTQNRKAPTSDKPE